MRLKEVKRRVNKVQTHGDRPNRKRNNSSIGEITQEEKIQLVHTLTKIMPIL